MSDEDKQAKKDKKAIKKLDALRNKGDWESEISDSAPAKDGTIRRVSMFARLPSGLTPYEMMYGQQENDYNLLNKFLD